MNKLDLISIRNMKPEDQDFIFATWLRGLRYGNSWFEIIEASVYYRIYHKVIENILKNPKTTVKIACLKDDPDVILGYAVYAKTRLDWLFVKKAWRMIGIAKSLTPSGVTVVTHLTNAGLSLLKKHPDIQFNPFELE